MGREKQKTHAVDFSDKDLDVLLSYFSFPLRNHSRRVAVCSSIMAEYAGHHSFLDGVSPAIVHLGGTCHDVGKLLIPAFPADETVYMRHPLLGAEFLEKNKDAFFSNEQETQAVLEMVRCHHEQADGSGFPKGLCTKDIPMSAGICAIANRFDHLVVINDEISQGSFNGASRYIIDNAGKLFAESAVHCFEQVLSQIIEQYGKWKSVI